MSIEPTGIAQVVERCAWCGCALESTMRVLIAGGRFADQSLDLDRLRGQVVRVRTARALHRIPAIVPLPDTPAHSAGYDLLFVLCSIECRDALDVAIGDEPMMLSRPGPAWKHGPAEKGPRANGRGSRGSLRRRPS